MNFTEAMKVLLSGGKVSLNGVVYVIEAGGYGLVNESSGDSVPFTASLLDATTFAATPSIPTLEADEIYVVFNETAARWVSTTNVAKHKVAGRRTAIFHLSELI